MCFELQHAKPCIFVINVVNSTSMQTRLRNVVVFRDMILLSLFPAVILMPCKLYATLRSMLILRYFTKVVLNMVLCSIYSCLWLKLGSDLACHFLALLLLNNVPGRLLTC